jgi:hypothetical protein
MIKANKVLLANSEAGLFSSLALLDLKETNPPVRFHLDVIIGTQKNLDSIIELFSEKICFLAWSKLASCGSFYYVCKMSI